jgi:translation initiation factor 2B subunit (eIF-2B alpha/beta/delta family)
VIIAEAAPALSGLKLATSLSKVTNISVTLIPDSNIYAIMSRMNKVCKVFFRFDNSTHL